MREPDSVVPASRGSLGSLASEGFVVLTCDPGAGLIQTCNAERREDDERVRGHGVKATRGWFIDCLRLDLKSTLIKNWHSLMASIWFLDNTACDRIDEPRDEQRAGSEGSLRGTSAGWRTREGMTGTTGSNSPARRESVDNVRQIVQRRPEHQWWQQVRSFRDRHPMSRMRVVYCIPRKDLKRRCGHLL